MKFSEDQIIQGFDLPRGTENIYESLSFFKFECN